MPVVLPSLRRPEKSHYSTVCVRRAVAVLAYTLLFGLLFAVYSERVAAQGRADPHEREYRNLTSNADLTIQGHLGIVDWCLRVAKREPRFTSLYNSRGANHVKAAEKLAKEEIAEIFRDARSRVKRARGYEEALNHREAADQAARETVESLVDQFESYSSLETVRDAYESGGNAMEAALRPFISRGALERVRDGNFLLDGKWVRLDSNPTESFEGLVALSKVRREPGGHLHRYFATEFISSGELFKILDLTLLDGYDDRGEYLVPHFMDGRVVLTLPDDSYNWNEEFAKLRKLTRSPEAVDSPKNKARYRFRILATMVEGDIQSTRFFRADIEQLAVFDDRGKLLQYFGPIPERL